MTDTELKKLIEDCCDYIFNRLEPLANVKSRLYESLKPAINYTRCCCKLKDKEKMTFEEWRKANKFKHIYGYYYKNDDKLNHEQVQQIYIEYLKNL